MFSVRQKREIAEAAQKGAPRHGSSRAAGRRDNKQEDT
jgi:hypothetical protein